MKERIKRRLNPEYDDAYLVMQHAQVGEIKKERWLGPKPGYLSPEQRGAMSKSRKSMFLKGI